MSRMTRLVLLAGACLGTASFLMAQPTHPPDQFLELDGNAVVDGTACTAPNTPAGCKDDWNLLNGDGVGAHPGSAGGSLARSFISGSASIAVFTTGASKDPIDVSQWKWKNGGTPDKNAITNGYAAAYQAPDGNLVLEFGADRFAVNGDANIGFWFFQQDVHPVGATGGGFSGTHVNGDIFVVSAFTQGGGVSHISVYVWDNSCSRGVNNPAAGQCAETNLRLKFDSAPTTSCNGTLFGCAVVNTAEIPVSWAYLSKFGNGSTLIPAGGFYEGGINVTELLGAGTVECFSSFLIETRSSQTPSATLKDFVAGSFSLCGLSATKTCRADGVLNSGGTSIHYIFDGTVQNTGVGGLSGVTVVDTLPAGSTNVVFMKGTANPADTVVAASACPTGSPAGATCANLGTVAAGATEYWSVEFDSTSLGPQNDVYAAASASGGSPGECTAGGTVCSAPAQASCSVTPSNSITISKNCAVPASPAGYPNAPLPGTQLVTSGGLAAVRVNFSGVITNSGQTTLTGITVADNPAATINVAWPGATGTLAPAATAKYSGSYLPTGVTAGDLGGAAGRYSFSDEIKVTGATAALGTSPGAEPLCQSTFTTGAQACAPATCNICPAGATCYGN